MNTVMTIAILAVSLGGTLSALLGLLALDIRAKART